MSLAIDHGHLPSGRHIVNHDTADAAVGDVRANPFYAGRALGLSEPWDIIQLPPELEVLWPAITTHYDRIGLQHATEVIWHLHPAELGEHIGYYPSVFRFGPRHCYFWGDNAWLDTAEFIGSRNNFATLARELGVDVPETLCFERTGDVAVADVRYPCYVKTATRSAGRCTYRCEDRQQLLEALDLLDSTMPVQLQEALAAVSFLDLQYRVTGKAIFRMAVTEQAADVVGHPGYHSPANHAPWDSVEPMAEWLSERGLKGDFCFRVAAVQTKRGLRFRVIDCKPQFSEAAYPAVIAHKLRIRDWFAITLVTRHRDLAGIDLAGIEFDPAVGSGVVIVNWGAVLEGELQVMIAGDRRQPAALRVALDARL